MGEEIMSKYILMATENPLSGNLDASFVQSGNVEVGIDDIYISKVTGIK